MASRFTGWKNMPIAAIIPWPGSTRENDRSSWRVLKPVIDQEKCVRCRMCWTYCPDGAIVETDKPYTTKSGRRYRITFEIDYRYCKGCGICAAECPVKAIAMVPEEV